MAVPGYSHVRKLLQKLEERNVRQQQDILEELRAVIRRQNLTGQIAAIEEQKQLLAHMYERASAYTNLVMLGGYAGLFAIWRFTRDLLPYRITALVAALTLISILMFVAFEVIKDVSAALLVRKLAHVINSGLTEQDRGKAWQQVLTSHAVKQSLLWPWFLITTVATGSSAGGILLFALLSAVFTGTMGE